MKKIYYQTTHEMTPRDGVKFATTYYKQTPKQRKELVRHVVACVREIAVAIEADYLLQDFVENKPLKGFKRRGSMPNRTVMTIVTDLIGEAQGRKRDGKPKDFAQAPIERWNKLFKDTPYEFEMCQGDSAHHPIFNDLWELEETSGE